MTCPSEEELLRLVLGELRVHDAQALEPHIGTCVRCMAALRSQRQLLSDLAVAPPRATSAELFSDHVMARLEEPRVPARLASVRWARRAVAPIAAAAALALCAIPLRSALLAASEQTHEVRARGAGSAHPRSFAEAFSVRAGVFTAVEGAQLHDGDALAVRCTNTREQAMRLLVFAIDAAERVHWIYPAFVDPIEDPESITIAPRTLDYMLEEMVEPEHVAAGTFRVFSVMSQAPLKVSSIERARHALYTGAKPAFLSGSDVEEWSATWSDE